MHDEATPIPLGEFRAKIHALYEAAGRRPETTSRMDRVLRELQQAGAATTADLTTDMIVAWERLHAPGRNANTTIGLLAVLHAAASYAAEEGLLARVPSFRRIRPRPVVPRRKPWLAWEDVGRLLEHLRAEASGGEWADRRLHALVATAALTGMRRDELLFARPVDLDLAGRLIRLTSIPERPLKTASSARPVPICPDLAEVLEGWLPAAGPRWLFPGARGRTAWHGGGPGRRPIDALRRAAIEVGIPKIGWQVLRHSWATHAETRWGLSGPAIDRILGHARPGCTAGYTHADEANLVELARRISYRA